MTNIQIFNLIVMFFWEPQCFFCQEQQSSHYFLNLKTADFFPGELANNNQSQKASELDDADTPFRRQHFDRNSMLRHSKKRKKSSVSSNGK